MHSFFSDQTKSCNVRELSKKFLLDGENERNEIMTYFSLHIQIALREIDDTEYIKIRGVFLKILYTLRENFKLLLTSRSYGWTLAHPTNPRVVIAKIIIDREGINMTYKIQKFDRKTETDTFDNPKELISGTITSTTDYEEVLIKIYEVFLHEFV